jgi:hypothetical protein
MSGDHMCVVNFVSKVILQNAKFSLKCLPIRGT